MVDLSKTRRKIEDIRSDNGKVVDTIAGGLLRTFVRLNERRVPAASDVVTPRALRPGG